MRDYTRLVIEKEWPAHKNGLALEDGDAVLDRLENEVMTFEPTKEREKIAHAEVLALARHRPRSAAAPAASRLHGAAGRTLGGGLDRRLASTAS